MLVSLFTDASVCGKTGLAGWGAWARSDRGRAYAGGPMPDPVSDVGVAEFMAVMYGVRLASERSVLAAGDHVLVQSDSMEVVRSVNGRLPGGLAAPEKRELRAVLFERLRGLGATASARHVKGHSGTGQPRFWVNSLCDDLARRGMETARAGADFPEVDPEWERWSR